MKWFCLLVLFDVMLAHVAAYAAAENFECQYCEANTYCFIETQHFCPQDSSAPEGSDNVSDCICHAGFYRNGDHCNLCEENHYCRLQLQLSCPDNAVSISGSSLASMCKCKQGFTASSEDPLSCVPCAKGTIKDSIGNAFCTSCAANTYSLNSTACGACPLHTQSEASSESATDCVATQGAYMMEGMARLCPPGTYQDSINQSSCKLCEYKTYQPLTGAKHVLNCLSCPVHASVQQGPGVQISNCSCDHGFFGNGTECAPCAAGTFKATAGSSACQQCDVNTYSGSGEISCTACPEHSSSAAGSQALAYCTCAAGYAAQETTFSCVACAAGSAKMAAANTACEMCAAGSFAPHSAMTACKTCPADTFSNLGSAQCVNCSAHEFSAPGADSAEHCSCVAGFFRPTGFDNNSLACASCALGFFRNATHTQDWRSLACLPCPTGYSTLSVATVSADGCYQCPAGAYAADRGELGVACVQCGENAQSEPGIVDGCECIAGFQPFLETCKSCDFGYYKPLAGNHTCTACAAGKQGTAGRTEETTACAACPANTHWTAFGERCTACPAHSLSSPGSVSASNCSCNTGFRYSIIAAGEYSDNTTWRDSEGYYCFQYADMRWCIDNALGTAQDLLWSASRDGTFASFAVDGVDASQACYLCGGGLLAQVAFPACLPCDAGAYKPQVSNDVSCLLCAGKSYSHSAAATACEQCPAHSTGGLQNNASSDCTCDAGFTGPAGGPCAACASGKFKTEKGEATCTDCGASAYWPVGADPAFNQCQACPAHSTRLTDLTYGILGCICDAGYHRTANDTCSLCTAGSYCPQQYQQLKCPVHSHSSTGQSTIFSCECTAGLFGAAGNCSVCPVNTYCGSNTASPAPCPANSTTLGQAERTNISACVCVGGFFRNNNTCQECERNSFCFGETQMACPANSSAIPGADSVLDCICDDNFRLLPQQSMMAGVECAACQTNLICRENKVQTCATGAFNVNFRCVCLAGSYCPGGQASCLLGACTDCPHNHWCFDNNMSACAANEFAPANSSRHSQCRCLPGFYRHIDQTCKECPLHHVCNNETRRPVAEYDQNLRTMATRTVFLSQAVCALGHFRTAQTDVCKKCPANFFCPSEATVALPNVVRCPENEFSHAGASSRLDCRCLAGFKLATLENTAKCLACTAGERCQGGSVLEIECHLQNKAITADHSQCVCEIGFGFVNFECMRCPRGFVKPVIGDTPCVACGINQYAANDTTCLPCPALAMAHPGSAACKCQPPYVLHNNVCVLCPADRFWMRLETGAGECLQCPNMSNSKPTPNMPLGSDACRCATGHHVAPWNVSGIPRCQVCAEGHFESNGECLTCPAGAWAPERSESVKACVCNSRPDANLTCHSLLVDGTCAGVCASTQPECVACAPGHFKPTRSTRGNTETCQPCLEGHFQPAYASLFCETCPLNEWHIEVGAIDRTQCLCVAGFQRPDAEHNVSKRPCEACAPGYYSAWQGGACAPCAVGRYNPNFNATYCHFCSDATLAPNLDGNISDKSSFFVLHSNTTVSEASVSVLDCVCDKGHEPLDVEGVLACHPCKSGSFKAHKNHDHCAYCGASHLELGTTLWHHFGADNHGASEYTHCLPCPASSGQNKDLVGPGLLLMDDFNDCKCFPGHENRTALGCSMCPEYMIQPNFSDTACIFCDTGFYFVSHNLQCEPCHLDGDGNEAHIQLLLNSIDHSLPWATSSHDCVCRLGYQRNFENKCQACEKGKYRGSNLTRFCSECPFDTFQNSTAAQNCLACPLNSSTLGAQGIFTEQGCVCGPGFKPLNNFDVCEFCESGTFRSSRAANESQQACERCPANHYCTTGAIHPAPCPLGEFSSEGSSDISDCKCPPGSGRENSVSTNPCRLCAHGFFASSHSNTECEACPDFKNTSAPAATGLYNCTCIAGYGIQPQDHLENACLPCGNGFFASGGSNAQCTHCGWGAVTEPQSAATSADSCFCSFLQGLLRVSQELLA